MSFKVGRVYSGAGLNDAPEGTVVGLISTIPGDDFPWRKKITETFWEGEEGTLLLGPIAQYVVMEIPDETNYPKVILDSEGDVWVNLNWEDQPGDYFMAEVFDEVIRKHYGDISRYYGIDQVIPR